MNARKQYLEALGKEYNRMQRDDLVGRACAAFGQSLTGDGLLVIWTAKVTDIHAYSFQYLFTGVGACTYKLGVAHELPANKRVACEGQ